MTYPDSDHDTLETLVFDIEHGTEDEAAKAHEELAARGLLYEDVR